MKSSPMSPSLDVTRRSRAVAPAFSLIELLVAVAVLSLMVVLLGQMIQSSSQGWLDGKARISSFMKARSMLDLLQRDLQGGVFRGDLAGFAEASSGGSLTNVAFYTRRSGVPVNAADKLRHVSLVQYTLRPSGMLSRGDVPVSWDGAATAISFGVTNALPQLAGITDRDTVPGVVGFRILFVQTNGVLTNAYDPASRPKGAAIGLAFVDDNSVKKLTPDQLSELRETFDSHVSGTNSLKKEWEELLKSGGIAWANYPRDLGRGLKIFERYVLFP